MGRGPVVGGGDPSVGRGRGRRHGLGPEAAPSERTGEGDASGMIGGEGLGQFTTQVDTHHGIGTRAGMVEVSPDPTMAFELVGVAGGMPDFHGPKMGAIGVGITDALDNGQVALIQELVETAQGGVEGQVLIDFQQVLIGQGQAGSGASVMVIGPGDQGIEAIVAASQLEDHQGGEIRVDLSRVGAEDLPGMGEEGGDRPRQGATGEGGVEELPAGFQGEIHGGSGRVG